MRVLSVLTVAVVFSVLATAAGQTKKTQERGPKVSSQEIDVFWEAARKSEACRSVRKSIKFYRSKTWKHQDGLNIRRSMTLYPERIPSRCPYLRWNVKRWQRSAVKHRKQLENLVNASPEQIIRHLFPNSTEYRAVGVASCESRLNTYAQNSSSGTSGLFQIHPGNRGRVIYWKYHGSIIISGNLFDPWNNTKIALYMSKGGVDWHEWASVCQR